MALSSRLTVQKMTILTEILLFEACGLANCKIFKILWFDFWTKIEAFVAEPIPGFGSLRSLMAVAHIVEMRLLI